MNRRHLAIAVAAATLLAACGGDDDPATVTATPSTRMPASMPGTSVPVTPTTTDATVDEGGVDAGGVDAGGVDAGGFDVVDARGTTVHVTTTNRVIPLDGDVAEIIFALGFGDRVVATDLSATYPPEADALPQIGYQRALSTEPIAAFEPDLLIGTDLAGPPETIDELERLGIPVVIVPSDASPTGPADKIRAVAAALGQPDAGAALGAATDDAIAAVAADPALAGLRVLALYVRGENTQLVLGKGSGIDWLIAATGAVDVGTELGVVDNAPLTAESIIAAEPDVLVVTTSGMASVGGVDGLVSIAALAATPAARNVAVLDYEDQLMLGNGPRTAEFLTQLQHDLLALVPTGNP